MRHTSMKLVPVTVQGRTSYDSTMTLSPATMALPYPWTKLSTGSCPQPLKRNCLDSSLQPRQWYRSNKHWKKLNGHNLGPPSKRTTPQKMGFPIKPLSPRRQSKWIWYFTGSNSVTPKANLDTTGPQGPPTGQINTLNSTRHNIMSLTDHVLVSLTLSAHCKGVLLP